MWDLFLNRELINWFQVLLECHFLLMLKNVKSIKNVSKVLPVCSVSSFQRLLPLKDDKLCDSGCQQEVEVNADGSHGRFYIHAYTSCSPDRCRPIVQNSFFQGNLSENHKKTQKE